MSKDVMKRTPISYTKVLEIAKRRRGKNQNDLAECLGMSSASISSKMNRGTIRVDEFFKMLEYLGCEIRVIDSETREDITELSGSGRSVRGWINSTFYDTDSCTALANDFYQDGVTKYKDGKGKELYVDSRGRYFFALYSNGENDKDRLELVSPIEARAFIAKWGREIFKGTEARIITITSTPAESEE